MSVSLLNRQCQSNGNDCTQEREGIFDQFSERGHPELCYYVVCSSSDSEGNITVIDVKREKFPGNVGIVPKNEEESEQDAECKLQLKKQYGFRTRRLRNHRDIEFDTSMCTSTDDSCESDPAFIASDDEPYDLAFDNWAVVRGAKKKSCEANTKLKNASSRNLSSRGTETKKQSTNVRKSWHTDTLHKPNETTGNLSLKKAQNLASVNVPLKPPKKPRETQIKGEEKIPLKDVVPLPTFPKKSPNKIRFGYNSTAPKVPEMRPIKRRQLRQTTNRELPDLSTTSSEASSSSDEETPISMKTKAGMKLSRICDADKTEPMATTSLIPESQKKPLSLLSSMKSTATVTASGNGLKMVIRRQSIEDLSLLQCSMLNSTSKAESAPHKEECVPPAKKHNINVKKFAKTANRDYSVNKHPIQSALTRDGVDGDTTPANPDKCLDLNHHEGSPTSNTEIISHPSQTGIVTDCQSQTASNEEQGKKKKKKKRKKERGRSASTAGIDEACDAQYTAMRLAMELPRHNWLVNALIEAKKIKAEDDKPLNTARENEETSSQVVTATDSKRRTSTGDIPSIPQQQVNSPNADFVELQLNSDTSYATHTVHSEDTKKSEDLFNNPNNYLKGSSMVGIVKPFQHINKPPRNFKGGDVTPPPLCIVDDEESQNLITADTNGSKACGFAVGNSELVVTNSSVNSSVIIASPVSIAVSYSTVKNIDNGAKTEQTIAQATSNNDPDDHRDSRSTDVQTSSANDLTCKPHPKGANNTTANARSISNRDTLPSDGVNSTNATPDVETENEIKISNCFSLALDLTKKVEPKTEQQNNSPGRDQPLDLSIKSKSGEISPKILDLTVKKSPRIDNTNVSTATNMEATKSKLAVFKPVTPSFIDQRKPEATSVQPLQREERKTTPPISANSPAIAPGASLKAEEKKITQSFIVIDEPMALPKKSKSDRKAPLPSASVPESKVNRKLSNATKPSSNAMKRCASLDAAFSQVTRSPEQIKCARMSLDDSRLSNVKSSSAPPAGKRSTGMRAPSRKKKSSFEVIARNLPSIPDRDPSITSPVIDKPFVVPPQTVPRMSIDHTASIRIRPVEQRPAFNQVRPPQANYCVSHHPPSYQATSRSTTVLTNNYVAPVQYPPAVNHQMTVRSPNTPVGMNNNNIRARMVAKEYQPNNANLEPYIKAQQRIVDEKIKALEAIKRQLADASESGKNNGPPQDMRMSYPGPVKQVRQHYNPPVQMSFSIPKPVLTSTIHPGKDITSQNTMPRYCSSSMQSDNSHLNLQHQIPRPALMRGHMQQHLPPPQWRAMTHTTQERPHFLVHRPNGNVPMDANMTRQMQSTRIVPNSNFPRVAGSSASMSGAPNQVPVPRAFSQPRPGTMLQTVPTPRLPPPPTSTSVYRNGGLTINDALRTRLNEPIVIDDDVAQQSNNQLNHPRLPPNSTHSLKIRRAHSYHPPLSKNQNRYSAPRQPLTAPASQKPQSKTESCARCGGKAFFLCSGCRKIWYCNKNCQLQDWNVHSSICSV